MAGVPSPSRVQAPFASVSGGQVPGMAPYRVSMDMGMAGLEEQFGQAAVGAQPDERTMRAMAEPHHRQQQREHQHQHHQHQHHPVHHQHQHGQFGILAPTPLPQMPMPPQQHPGHQVSFVDPSLDAGAVASVDASGAGESRGGGHGAVSEDRMVFDPPDLQAWRQKLFNVDEMIVLTNEQYEMYWPHVDNVYSHRSTQRYKRKPFVSHYWDCRMKGRPSGTPKSEDPNKKKRKRVARERDLCDVKIKVTEYFPGAQIPLDADAPPNFIGFQPEMGHNQSFWTIQRVNGNGGNGKGDGVAGPHKHSLERSDEIKKNTVQRLLAKQNKEAKKLQKPTNRKASGAALATIKKHSKDSDIKLYAACFCPFSQRVWIALEAKGLAYQYGEIDPYKKPVPAQLLEANPRGLVPAIRQGDWAISESAVILEYLEDLSSDVPLSPTDPRLKANCRLWIDHINMRIVPAFYALLKQADPSLPSENLSRLQSVIASLLSAADENGPFFLGATLSLVDIHFAPFALRLQNLPVDTFQPSDRWMRWLTALAENGSVAKTMSGAELYDDTKAVLAENPPPGLVIPG